MKRLHKAAGRRYVSHMQLRSLVALFGRAPCAWKWNFCCNYCCMCLQKRYPTDWAVSCGCWYCPWTAHGARRPFWEIRSARDGPGRWTVVGSSHCHNNI